MRTSARTQDLPQLSVLLPVRDGASTLAEALASVLRQEGVALEVVAVDDGSEDESASLLERAAATDPRVRVVRTPPRGLVAALETARRRARAPLLARMDADDIAHPGRFAVQKAAMDRHPDWAVCGGQVRVEPREGLTDGRLRYERWLNGLTSPEAIERDLFVECPLAHPTWMLRAAAAEEVDGYRDRGWPEDYDLLLRFRAAGWRLGTVAEEVLTWRDSPGRLSRSHPDYTLASFTRCRAHHLARVHPRARDGVVVCGTGPVGKSFARALMAEDVPVRAFVDVDPRKIGQQIHGAPVLAHDAEEPLRELFTVAAVSGQTGRRGIRESLEERGFVEGVDFVAVA